jgi:Flp pilus assembly protein TadG
MRKHLRHFTRNGSATSAVEFALVLPLFLLILLGSVEFNRYFRFARHLATAADTVGSMMAQRIGPLGATDAEMDFNSSYEVFREAAQSAATSASWANYMGHQITQVVFKPTVATCTSGCTYVANVAWVWPTNYVLLGSLARVCGTLLGAVAGTAPSGASIPQNLFGPGSMIVVDLTYDYTPLFGSRFLSPMRIVKQAFYAPRFASPYISSGTLNTVTQRCSGY